MFKLIAVAGKIRGAEFLLNEGSNILGRDPECDICTNISGVSKRHLELTVSGKGLYVQDLGSSNGTFVNGKIVQRCSLKAGDKISLPDLILSVVEIKEKKKIIKKKVRAEVDEEEEDEETLEAPPMPSSLFAKPVYLFRYRLMPVLHGINEEYEWKSLLGIMVALFAVATISFTIFPVLQDSKKLLLYETAKRGAHFADEIARMNARALSQKNLDRVDSNFLNREDGVASYELFDLEGRIVRPLGKLNEYISDPFSVEAKNWAERKKSVDTSVLKKRLGDGEIGIAQVITAYDARSGSLSPVGIIAIRFAPRSLAIEATKNSKAYLEALLTSAIVATFFFGIIYFLTIRHFEELRFMIEEALRGKIQVVEPRLLFGEMKSLVNSVNSLIQRVRESSGEADDTFLQEDDTKYVETLLEFARGAQGPIVVLDSEKKIKRLNVQAEDLLGVRESAAEDMDLLDILREQGLAATISELCDMSASNAGTNQSGSYELTGKDYEIHVSSLIGNDSFAKAFYITFVEEE